MTNKTPVSSQQISLKARHKKTDQFGFICEPPEGGGFLAPGEMYIVFDGDPTPREVDEKDLDIIGPVAIFPTREKCNGCIFLGGNDDESVCLQSVKGRWKRACDPNSAGKRLPERLYPLCQFSDQQALSKLDFFALGLQQKLVMPEVGKSSSTFFRITCAVALGLTVFCLGIFVAKLFS